MASRLDEEFDDMPDGGIASVGDSDSTDMNVEQQQESGETKKLPHVMNIDGLTVSQIIDKLGFGKFQIGLMMLVGFASIADAMEMMILSILGPALHCHWHITELQQATLTTVVFLGMMISSPIWGSAADLKGRRFVIIWAVLFLFIFGFLTAFAPNFYTLMSCRLIVGFFIGGVPQATTLCAEYMPSASRGASMVSLSFFWAIGTCFEAMLAWLVMPTLGWRYLIALSAMPLCIFLAISRYLPESPVFLADVGRVSEARLQLDRVAVSNTSCQLVGQLHVNQPDDANFQKGRGRFIDLFRDGNATTTLLVFFMWLVAASNYYGIVLLSTELLNSSVDLCHVGGTLNSTSTVGHQLSQQQSQTKTAFNVSLSNITDVHYLDEEQTKHCSGLSEEDYVSLVWTTLAEFPGTLLAMIMIDWIGRRKSLAMHAGLFSIFVAFVYSCNSDRRFLVISLFIARALTAGFFQTIYVYTPEVYDTSLRAMALGSGSAVARIGAMITPYVAQVLLKFNYPAAISFYVVSGLLASLAAYMLTIETSGRSMYSTQMEKIQSAASTVKAKVDATTAALGKTSNTSGVDGDQTQLVD